MCNVSLTWTIICSFICCYLTGGLRDWKVFHLFNLVYTFAAVFVSTVLGLSHKTLQCSYPCCFSLLWPRHRQIKRHVYIFWILILKMCSLSVGWQNLFVNPLKFFKPNSARTLQRRLLLCLTHHHKNHAVSSPAHVRSALHRLRLESAQCLIVWWTPASDPTALQTICNSKPTDPS